MHRLAVLTFLLAALSLPISAKPLDRQETILTPHCGEKWCWEDCGKATDPLHVTYIDVTPDPPRPGQPMTVTARGTANRVIEEGAYADVAVKVGRIKILQKEFDLCEEARNANTSIKCPVSEGVHEITHTVVLPKEIPPAPFNVHINGYTADDDDLVCLDLSIDFRKRRF